MDMNGLQYKQWILSKQARVIKAQKDFDNDPSLAALAKLIKEKGTNKP